MKKKNKKKKQCSKKKTIIDDSTRFAFCHAKVFRLNQIFYTATAYASLESNNYLKLPQPTILIKVATNLFIAYIYIKYKNACSTHTLCELRCKKESEELVRDSYEKFSFTNVKCSKNCIYDVRIFMHVQLRY